MFYSNTLDQWSNMENLREAAPSNTNVVLAILYTLVCLFEPS